MNFRKRDPVIITSGRHRGTKGVLTTWDGKYWCVARARGYLVFSKPEHLQLISVIELEHCSRMLLEPEDIDENYASKEKNTYTPFDDLRSLLKKDNRNE